jgi:hypothetical protein
VAPNVPKHAIEGGARLFTRVELFGRQHNEAQGTIVRNIAVRGEDMRAIEKRRVAGEPLENLGHAAAHCAVFKPLLALFHFAPQVGTGVEPITGRFLRLVADAFR